MTPLIIFIIFLSNIICNHYHLYWPTTAFCFTLFRSRDLKRVWRRGRGRGNSLPNFFGIKRLKRCSMQAWYDSIFYSIQFSLRKFWFDSTHDSQWLYKNWFKSAHDSKWISEIWFKSTHDSKSFQNTLIQINSRLKTFPECWFRSNHDSKNYLAYWFESITQWFESVVGFVDLCWAFTQFRWPFWGFQLILLTFWGFLLKCCVYMIFLGHLTQVPWFESAHDLSCISKTWIDSTHESSGFPGIDSESIHDSSGFPRYLLIQIGSWLKVLPHFSIQINSGLKRKAFDSMSTHGSTLSHTRVW